MNDTEKKFYQETVKSIDRFTDILVNNIASGKVDPLTTESAAEYDILHKKEFSREELAALKKVLREKIIDVVHSLLVSIDGGTALSDSGKALELIDTKENQPLTTGALHENFMELVVSKTSK